MAILVRSSVGSAAEQLMVSLLPDETDAPVYAFYLACPAAMDFPNERRVAYLFEAAGFDMRDIPAECSLGSDYDFTLAILSNRTSP